MRNIAAKPMPRRGNGIRGRRNDAAAARARAAPRAGNEAKVQALVPQRAGAREGTPASRSRAPWTSPVAIRSLRSAFSKKSTRLILFVASSPAVLGREGPDSSIPADALDFLGFGSR